jgi:hypothetical protein
VVVRAPVATVTVGDSVERVNLSRVAPGSRRVRRVDLVGIAVQQSRKTVTWAQQRAEDGPAVMGLILLGLGVAAVVYSTRRRAHEDELVR